MLWIGLEVGQEFMSTAARLADADDLEDAIAGKRAPTDANTDPYQHGLPAERSQGRHREQAHSYRVESTRT
jgi:hypothetical protein